MKKLALLLMTTVFLTHASFAESTVSDSTNPAPKQTIAIDNNWEIVAVTRHEEDATLPYTIDVNYPQITGDNLSTNAQQFNRLVMGMVDKSVLQFKNYVKADMVHMQTLPDSVKHNSFQLDYKADVLTPPHHTLISLRLSIEGFQAGRAHPYHTHQVLNYDLDKGKTLTLKDLFKAHTNYLSVFAKYSSEALNKKLQDKWMIKDGTAPLPKNYLLWNLKKQWHFNYV